MIKTISAVFDKEHPVMWIEYDGFKYAIGITAKYVAVDACGSMYAYESKPSMGSDWWAVPDEKLGGNPKFIDYVGLPDDWKKEIYKIEIEA